MMFKYKHNFIPVQLCCQFPEKNNYQTIYKIILRDYYFSKLRYTYSNRIKWTINFTFSYTEERKFCFPPENETKLKRRSLWLYSNVRNVERPRKADASPKSALNVLRWAVCRSRRGKNHRVAAAPVPQKNNEFQGAGPWLKIQLRGLSIRPSSIQPQAKFPVKTGCRLPDRAGIPVSSPGGRSDSFDIEGVSL